MEQPGAQSGEAGRRPMDAPPRIKPIDQTRHPKGLASREQRMARAFMEALFHQGDAPAPAHILDWAVDELFDFMAHGGPRARLAFRACLEVVERAAPPLVFRAGGFSKLSLELRVKALHRLENSPASLALLGAKVMPSLIYYEHPENQAKVGFTTQSLLSIRKGR